MRPLQHLWTDRSLKIEINLDPNSGEQDQYFKIGLPSYDHLFFTNFLSNCKSILISMDANEFGRFSWPNLPLANSDLKYCSYIYLKQQNCLERVEIGDILDYLLLGTDESCKKHCCLKLSRNYFQNAYGQPKIEKLVAALKQRFMQSTNAVFFDLTLTFTDFEDYAVEEFSVLNRKTDQRLRVFSGDKSILATVTL
uniref:Uncharacterized protein n=1 Tax=Ditylenchus dipsaci TaxID=166011 RepID=A0A915EAD8_9BILA